MKHLALILLLAPLLSAQIFAPPGSVRRYAGTPTAGDCTASAIGRRAVDYSAIPSAHYKCSQTSSGVYEWEQESAGGGSGDITGVTAGTGLTGGGTSGAVTLAIDSSVVTGAPNLTTVGAIPYVSASGVLSHDSPWLHWDAPNNALGIGTSTPVALVGSRLTINQADTVTALAVINGSNRRFAINPISTGFQMFDGGSGSAWISGYVQQNGNVGIGPSNTSPTGTLHVYDATATTGDTIVNIRDGAAAPARINFAPFGSATADAGLRHSSANNLAVTNGFSTEYWRLGAGGILAGTDNSIDIGASGASRPRSLFLGTNATVGGDFIGASTSCVYLGATGTDGSWRWCRSGNNSVMERRESGSWVSKQVVTP